MSMGSSLGIFGFSASGGLLMETGAGDEALDAPIVISALPRRLRMDFLLLGVGVCTGGDGMTVLGFPSLGKYAAPGNIDDIEAKAPPGV